MALVVREWCLNGVQLCKLAYHVLAVLLLHLFFRTHALRNLSLTTVTQPRWWWLTARRFNFRFLFTHALLQNNSGYATYTSGFQRKLSCVRLTRCSCKFWRSSASYLGRRCVSCEFSCGMVGSPHSSTSRPPLPSNFRRSSDNFRSYERTHRHHRHRPLF